MNQQQREYLVNRIRSIEKRKDAELDKKYIIKHPTPIKTDPERWKLVLTGKVKLIKNPELNEWRCTDSYRLESLYDFSRFKDKVDTKRLKPARKKLTREVQRIRDLAMLGDCEQAVALLTELEKFEI